MFKSLTVVQKGWLYVIISVVGFPYLALHTASDNPWARGIGFGLVAVFFAGLGMVRGRPFSWKESSMWIFIVFFITLLYYISK